MERVVEVVGSLVADERVTVTNEVPGTVAMVHADFGDVVEAGAVLLELDRRELELQLGVARAALAQAEARQTRAQGNWNRAQRLFAEEAVSGERRDGVQAELRVAVADREAASKQLALAEKHLADATVRAPFRAAVQARQVAPGQHVPVFTPLFELVALDPVKFRGEAPERFASSLRVGLPVRLELEGAEGVPVETTIARVASALTPSTRSLAFECDLANPEGRLPPGRFARARLRLDAAPTTLIPRPALVQFAGVDRAFVVRDGRAEARTITVGDQFGDRIEILAGIDAGEQVVTAGQERLADGVTVDLEEGPS
jgi:RND family efflux transporter MFP subunit